VEEELGTQYEEFVQQIKDEMSLVPLMAAGKPWEVPEDYTLEVTVKHY
jgi:hypothetical protein